MSGDVLYKNVSYIMFALHYIRSQYHMLAQHCTLQPLHMQPLHMQPLITVSHSNIHMRTSSLSEVSSSLSSTGTTPLESSAWVCSGGPAGSDKCRRHPITVNNKDDNTNHE